MKTIKELWQAIKSNTNTPETTERVEEHPQPTFMRGQKVKKSKGYAFRGTVVSSFQNLSGEERFVVEKEGEGFLHIYSAHQLKPVINEHDETYLSVLRHVLNNGTYMQDRTGTGVYKVFDVNASFDLNNGFPLLTTKHVWFEGLKQELFWMLSGSTNVYDLPENVRKLWSPWADPDGELGPIYGRQWRNWPVDGSVKDQIKNVITSLNHDPYSRRHVVSAWNAGETHKMNLPPCHILFQFVPVGDTLNLKLYQRSSDVFLGLPFNIAQYSLLLRMMCVLTNFKPGTFSISIGDAHLYSNHIGQAQTQLEREPFAPPNVLIKHKAAPARIQDIEDAQVFNYNHHPKLPAPLAV